jgi:hypothetical protein
LADDVAWFMADLALSAITVFIRQRQKMSAKAEVHLFVEQNAFVNIVSQLLKSTIHSKMNNHHAIFLTLAEESVQDRSLTIFSYSLCNK